MTRRTVAGLVLALPLLVAAGCDPEPSSPSPEELGAVDVSPDHTITVDEGGFHPDELTVAPGDVIEVENTGEEEHSATAESRFDTGRLQPGDAMTLVLVDPGTIPFWDVTDPDRTATVTVEP